MPPVLNVDRELGRKIKAAREQRGWSKPLLAAMIGPLGDPPRGLVPNQITRMESGERNLTADEAWRLVDLYEEIDPWEILAGARVVSPDSSEEFRQAIREEAERRRRRGALRRLDVAAVGATSDQRDPKNGRSWRRAGERRRGERRRHLRLVPQLEREEREQVPA